MSHAQFHHIALPADPERVSRLREALRTIVEEFDFRAAVSLKNEWANPWWEEYFSERVPLDADALQALLTRLAGELPNEFDLPTVGDVPESGSVVHLRALEAAVDSLVEHIGSEAPPQLADDPGGWELVYRIGIDARLQRITDYLEVLAGLAPAFEPEEDVEDFVPSAINPIHLFSLIGELLTYCIDPNASTIGLAEAYNTYPAAAGPSADPDPYTPGVPTPEEFAHSPQPRRAYDQWPDPELWRPTGLSLEPLLGDWHADPRYAELYTRPVVAGLMRGPVGYAVGAALESPEIAVEFAEACRAAQADGNAVLTWVEAFVD